MIYLIVINWSAASLQIFLQIFTCDNDCGKTRASVSLNVIRLIVRKRLSPENKSIITYLEHVVVAFSSSLLSGVMNHYTTILRNCKIIVNAFQFLIPFRGLSRKNCTMLVFHKKKIGRVYQTFYSRKHLSP